ncbi:MAG TPA: rhomboid family intramembrane serine protease [Thermoplasmatales archaeon]|nr:rhomboid family intramembrane serine protease [Thermoplasmatales archaeon]
MTPAALLVIGIIGLFLAYALAKKMMISQALIIANFIIFVLTLFSPHILDELAFRPSHLTDVTRMYTLITSMFLHAGFLHIIGNMIVLLFVGMPFEQRIGAKRFILIYLAGGVAGTLFYSAANLNSTVPLVGASGAIFAVLGAFAAAYPRDEVVMLVPLPIMFFMRMKVVTAAVLFGLLQVVLLVLENYFPSGGLQNVAYLAHLGGLAAGIVLGVMLPKKEKSAGSEKIDFDELSAFVTTEKQRELLERAKGADEPEVARAWLSALKRQLKCPRCGGELEIADGVRCRRCGYRK